MIIDNIASTTFIDGIIGFLILEAMVRCAYHRHRQVAAWYRPALHNFAGVFLLLALRVAMTGADAVLITAALAFAFAAHVAELALDWRLSRRTTVIAG